MVSDQLLDITTRIPEIRPFVVEMMIKLLNDKTLISHVLYQAAWIVGEYYSDVNIKEIIYLLLDKDNLRVPSDVVRVYLVSALKLWGRCDDDDELKRFMINGFKYFSEVGGDLEVQERVSNNRIAIYFFKGIHEL